jgi:rare lipoprotein A
MNRVLSIMAAALVMVASTGAAPVPKHPAVKSKENPPSQAENKPYQVGRASWYGKQFHGRTTANGESFDMFELTAAHKRLPLGSFVKVTNLKSGKWLVVRINDRGPFVGDRIVDLSYGAARLLGIVGVQKVRLDLIQPETLASVQGYDGLQ